MGAAMALREERSERNQQTWHSRLERERQDLSASVEAALVDNSVLEQQWQDESDEQERPRPTTGGTTLVPPRLSLQSKMLPAVRSGGFIEAATNSHSAVPSNSAVEQKSPPQNTGMLARLAQRFTSSFAAIGGSTKSGSLQQANPSTSARETISTQDTGEDLPPTSRMETSKSTEYPDVPLVRVIDTAPPTSSVVEAKPPEGGKQRSLKRNGKVRLETAEMHAIPKTPMPPKIEEQETGASMLASDVREALDRQQESLDADRHENENAVARSSVLEMFNGELGVAARGTLSGSGTFESGQGDVTIANERITASSVVLVTLTTNPGPVVVQYISLQPQVGFTVHLTAPVIMHTTFNYVVLLGELF